MKIKVNTPEYDNELNEVQAKHTQLSTQPNNVTPNREQIRLRYKEKKKREGETR